MGPISCGIATCGFKLAYICQSGIYWIFYRAVVSPPQEERPGLARRSWNLAEWVHACYFNKMLKYIKQDSGYFLRRMYGWTGSGSMWWDITFLRLSSEAVPAAFLYLCTVLRKLQLKPSRRNIFCYQKISFIKLFNIL